MEGKGTASLFGAIRTETIMKLLEFPKVDTPSESMLSLATSDVIHRLFRLFNEILLTTVFFFFLSDRFAGFYWPDETALGFIQIEPRLAR